MLSFNALLITFAIISVYLLNTCKSEQQSKVKLGYDGSIDNNYYGYKYDVQQEMNRRRRMAESNGNNDATNSAESTKSEDLEKDEAKKVEIQEDATYLYEQIVKMEESRVNLYNMLGSHLNLKIDFGNGDGKTPETNENDILNDIKSEIQALKDEIERLNQANAILVAENARLQQALSDCEGKVGECNEFYDTCKDDLKICNNEKETLQKELNQCNSDKDACIINLNTCNDEMKVCNTRFDTLKEATEKEIELLKNNLNDNNNALMDDVNMIRAKTARNTVYLINTPEFKDKTKIINNWELKDFNLNLHSMVSFLFEQMETQYKMNKANEVKVKECHNTMETQKQQIADNKEILETLTKTIGKQREQLEEQQAPITDQMEDNALTSQASVNYGN